MQATSAPRDLFPRGRARTEDAGSMDVGMDGFGGDFRGSLTAGHDSLAMSAGPSGSGSLSGSGSGFGHHEMASRSHYEERFQLYNEVLIHSATCTDNRCMMNGGRCHKVKASLDHFVRCYGPRRKISPIESCPTCSRIWGLLCYHAKTCPTPPGHHCIVVKCDYLREKIARKREQDQAELQRAQGILQSQHKETWPVERRIAQLEQDRQQVLQLIEQIRTEKARQLHQRSMTL